MSQFFIFILKIRNYVYCDKLVTSLKMAVLLFTPLIQVMQLAARWETSQRFNVFHRFVKSVILTISALCVAISMNCLSTLTWTIKRFVFLKITRRDVILYLRATKVPNGYRIKTDHWIAHSDNRILLDLLAELGQPLITSSLLPETKWLNQSR